MLAQKFNKKFLEQLRDNPVLQQNVKSHINNFVHQNHMTQANVQILESQIEQMLEGKEIKQIQVKLKSKISNKKSRSIKRDKFQTSREAG